MLNAQELTRRYLAQTKIMQLATSLDDQPWACTVHYYTDEDLNFYWISKPDREHSRQIARNPKVAAAVLVHENTPDEVYVIGISVSGTAELVGPQLPESIAQAYVEKHAKDPSLLANIASGQNPHQFYRLTPSRIILFDTQNFPTNPRQEIAVYNS